LYSLKFDLGKIDTDPYPFKEINSYVRLFGGHMLNSLYDFTEVNGVEFGKCVGGILQVCVGGGPMGFRGYSFAQDMLDGFSYIPFASGSVIFKPHKYISIERTKFVILPMMVSTEVTTLNIHTTIPSL
jgi:hypothetical protein